MDYYDILLAKKLSGGGGGEDNTLKVGYSLALMSGTGIISNNIICLDESNQFINTRRSLWLTSGTYPAEWYESPGSYHGSVSGVYAIEKPNNATKIKVLCATTCQIYFNELDASNGQTTSGWLDITKDTEFSHSLLSSTKKMIINFRYDSSNSTFARDRVLNKVAISFE